MKIGFLGFGKMGSAIANGIITSMPEAWIVAFDPQVKNLDERIVFAASAAEMEAAADIVLLCVKPQEMERAVAPLSGDKRYISIAAGLSSKRVASLFKTGPAVARAMPNMGALVGSSVTGYYCESDDLARLCDQIFSSVGVAIRFDSEEKIHAVTGLSGSGPAFAFAFIQALAEGGVLCGLPHATALQMAAQTVLGAAKTLLETGAHPDTLRNSVTSPGGTTIAGLHELERAAFHAAVMDAVEAATERSRELEG
jgi:pyrroline-5-carboxylate reductase